jgi:hypothetical protein
VYSSSYDVGEFWAVMISTRHAIAINAGNLFVETTATMLPCIKCKFCGNSSNDNIMDSLQKCKS